MNKKKNEDHYPINTQHNAKRKLLNVVHSPCCHFLKLNKTTCCKSYCEHIFLPNYEQQ